MATTRETARPLPEGTVTFLCTDVEGSTKLWERHPGAMQEALAGGVSGATVRPPPLALCCSVDVPPDHVEEVVQVKGLREAGIACHLSARPVSV